MKRRAISARPYLDGGPATHAALPFRRLFVFPFDVGVEPVLPHHTHPILYTGPGKPCWPFQGMTSNSGDQGPIHFGTLCSPRHRMT